MKTRSPWRRQAAKTGNKFDVCRCRESCARFPKRAEDQEREARELRARLKREWKPK